MKLKFNINSKHHLSALLFSGTVKYDDFEVFLDKKGQPKMKKCKKEYQIQGFGLNAPKEWKTKIKGVFKVGDEQLSMIADEYN